MQQKTSASGMFDAERRKINDNDRHRTPPIIAINEAGPSVNSKVESSSPCGALFRRLRRAELPRDTAALARYLVGKVVVHEHARECLAGRIVETEAYVVGDAAAHSFRGQTPRNASLFLERGHAYVYFVYGCWFALNVSAESAGIGAGVLLRALEPLQGIESMQHHRRTQRLLDLARGPGRLAMAMDVDRSFDGVDLCGAGPLWLGAALRTRRAVVGESVRIGITQEVDRKLRFFERDNAFVSGPRRLSA